MSTLTPTAVIEPYPHLPDSISVEVYWTSSDGPLDRPNVGGFIFETRQLKLAQRLARAIRAGVVYVDATVKTDVDGHTYVSARSRVMGKYANADLRKLGY